MYIYISTPLQTVKSHFHLPDLVVAHLADLVRVLFLVAEAHTQHVDGAHDDGQRHEGSNGTHDDDPHRAGGGDG